MEWVEMLIYWIGYEVSCMPAFLLVAVGVSALLALAVRPGSLADAIMLTIGLPIASATIADIGFLAAWVGFTGQFGPMISIPFFVLWIVGLIIALVIIPTVWAVARAVAKRKSGRVG